MSSSCAVRGVPGRRGGWGRPVAGALLVALATLVTLATFAPSAAAAQSPAVPSGGPFPPSPRPRVTAQRASAAPRLDGVLDEAAWRQASPIEGFRTVSPDIDQPAKARTVVRMLFTDEALYVGAMLYDSLGARGIRLQDQRRDFGELQSDWFSVVLDPLHDTRSAIGFTVSPAGSLRDAQGFDGGDVVNEDWDGVWRARTAVSDSGWSVEIEIPWSTLRFVKDGRAWGVNFGRQSRRTLEVSGLVPWPRQFSRYRMTFAADLHGLDPPRGGSGVRARPFALGDLSRTAERPTLGRPIGQLGGELLVSPTDNSLLELTANTDFAQADVDRQVVNLRRFSVFFPERRQFFLENTDVLNPTGVDGEYVVQPFFSRRIGLGDDGSLLPIRGGGRYSWRSGRASAGALVIHQAESGGNAAATFGVLRGSRFLSGATRVGAFAAIREDAPLSSLGASRPGARNIVTAVDALTRVGESVQMNGMLSTSTSGDTTSLAATWFAGRDTPGLYTGILGALVTEDYAPRTGFVSRSNVLLTSPAIVGTVQPAWRPKSVVWFKPALISYLYQTPGTGTLQEGYVQGYVDVFHTNGAIWYPYAERHFQRPTAPVALFDGVEIAPGTHDYSRYGLFAASDRSARLSLQGDLSGGTFFDGTLDRFTGTLRLAPSPRVAFTANYEVNRLRALGMRDTSLTTHLLAPELRVFMNPRLQFSAFYQYNTSVQRGALNARVSWEFQPLSFVYLVYNERRAIGDAVAALNQQLVLKVVWFRPW